GEHPEPSRDRRNSVMDLSVTVGGVSLTSPLVAASGTVGSVVDFADVIDFGVYGAAVAKSVAPEPWDGRPPPRIAPVDSAMLNGIGIQNPGIEAWVRTHGDQIGSLGTPVWGSVVAHDAAGFGTVATRMSATPVTAIEVNLSCPNLQGLPFALDASASAAVVRIVRAATDLPIGAKLSMDAEPIQSVAEAVFEAGADWVVVGNTVMGAAIDPETRRPRLSGGIGGYSGGPIRPLAIRAVMNIARDLPDIPIVGCGGVSTAAHVIEYVLAGASAVGIGSAHFADPHIAQRITKQLHRYAEAHSVASITELRGAYEPW
ncbi:MAG: dihydroorotate dehydrogenase, partial [Acidimicrobiia bacterium]|nr:dihydroorotate dehydrogenase [Acidimicrobiia bacterium]